MTDTTSAPAMSSKHPQLPPRPGVRVKNLAVCGDETWCGQSQHVWVDVESPTLEQVEELKRHFAFNKLALEDALETDHWSRFGRYPEHLFLIFRTLAEPEDLTDRTEEVDVFWFPEQHALVTFRNEPVTYLEATWRETNSFSGREPADVLYTLLQRGIDTFFAFLDEFEGRTDDLEQGLFAGPSSKTSPAGRDVRANPLCWTKVGSLCRFTEAFLPWCTPDVSERLTRYFRVIYPGKLENHYKFFSFQ